MQINGLKIRWDLNGPCRFESGHRHMIDQLSALFNCRCKRKPNARFSFR